MNALFAQLATTLRDPIAKAISFSEQLFGLHRFSFWISPDWPHQAIRTALHGTQDQSALVQSDWQILALTVTHEHLTELVKPYDRNRYGQLTMLGCVQGPGGVLTQMAFYDPLAKSLRAYDFDSQIAYILVTPAHAFAEWEIFSPFKEFWHYWALVHDSLVVHSGVVCEADGALVILGPGGAGKSTTTLSCVEYGMQTTGDDFNVLSMVDGRVWVYPLFRTIKAKAGNSLITGFRSLSRWPSQTYAADQKTIYFPPSADAIWQKKPAQVLAFLEPQWQSQDLPHPPAAKPVIQSAVSAILQHPYWAERYLQRMSAMLAQCPSHTLHLLAQPHDNVARIRALMATLRS